MTWLQAVALWFSPPGLFVCYFVYIQHERGPGWVVCEWIGGILGYLPDVLWNYVLCLCLTGKLPEKRTITIELPRLAKLPGLRGEFAFMLAKLLNWIAPSGKHVAI